MATHKDIAREVGVSQATVSKVLNNRANSIGISAKTRQAVIEAAKRLGYNRDKVASSFVALVDKTIVVLMEHVSNPYAGVIMRGIEQELSLTDFQYLFASSNGDADRSMHTIESLTRRYPSGFILMPFYETDTSSLVHSYLAERSIPFVQTGYHNLPGLLDAPLVTSNNRVMFRELTQHLIMLGHKRIAFVYTSPNYSSMAERRAGFEEAMKEAGLKIRKADLIELPRSEYFSVERKQSLLDRWMGSKSRPTAIMTVKDDCAMQFIRLIESVGLSVPGDMAVTGCDDYYHFIPKYYPEVYFRLTTIRQNLPEIGGTAVRELIRLIDHPEDVGKGPMTLDVPAKLVIRGSCGSREHTEPFSDGSLHLKGLGVGHMTH